MTRSLCAPRKTVCGERALKLRACSDDSRAIQEHSKRSQDNANGRRHPLACHNARHAELHSEKAAACLADELYP